MTTRTIAVTSSVLGVVALTTAGVLIATSMTPAVPSEPFVATELGDVVITQQSTSAYDISVAMPEEMAGAESMALTVTATDDADDNPVAVNAVVEGGRALIDSVELSPGDHFLWVDAGDGEPVSTPITIPDMNPFIWLDGEVPNIQFGQEGQSSWSSYVDPEGKHVYRSAARTFDETAAPIAESLPITETAFRDENYSADEPYYYLVFTGKSGSSTFVTTPLFTSATQGAVDVTFSIENDEPVALITGSVYATAEATNRSLSLRVGNFDAADPTSTFMVDNTSDAADPTAFAFRVPLSELDAGSNNLVIFLEEDGTMLEWSIRAPELDMTRSLQVGDTVYGIANPDALVLTRTDLAYRDLAFSLRESGGDAFLSVSGSFTDSFAGSGATLVVKEVDGESYTIENAAGASDRFSYSFRLSQLSKPTVWYDIEFVNPETEAMSPILASSVADFRQWVQAGDRTYALADFQGTTKVFFERFPYRDASVDLQVIGGEAMLVASGRLVDVNNGDAFLRLRTGDDVAGDVRNLSSVPGQFLYRFPLSELSQPRTWYDVVLGLRTNDSFHDFLTTSVTDMNKTITVGARTYGFREFNGQVKVQFDLDIGDIALRSAELVEVNGAPILRVTGTMTDLANDEVFLRVRTAGQEFDGANRASAAGAIRFDVNLSTMSQADTWYDLVVGNVPEGSLTDLSPSIANVDQTLRVGDRQYGFRVFNDQLKVVFSPRAGEVTLTAGELLDVNGVPTLRVTGTTRGLATSDVYLRVRTGEFSYDTQNRAATRGTVQFDVNLSRMQSADVWHDLVVGNVRDGSLTDLTPAIVDMNETLNLGGREYGFREFNGQLKVVFAPKVGSLEVLSGDLLDVDGVPTLRVVGESTGLALDDAFLRVRTGGQEFDVQNSAATAGELQFDADLSTLTQPDTWYDLLVGNAADGSLVDLTTAIVDMNQTLTLGGREFGFREFNGDLKVMYMPVAPGSVTIDSVSIVDDEGVPTLRVEGTTAGLAADDVFLRVRTGAQTENVPNSGTAGVALFEFDLSALTVQDTWYDLLVGVTSTNSLTDLNQSMADMSTSLTLNSRTYEFREFFGDLKVTFAAAAPGSVTVTSVDIVDNAGVPTLRVAGTLAGVSAGDAVLQIRSDAQAIEVPNSGTGSSAVFEQDLSVLTQEGTWYDLRTKIVSTNTLTDLKDSMADMATSLTLNSRTYEFREYFGDLKVNFAAAAPGSVTVTSVAIVDDAGVPTLRVEGTTTGLTPSDAFLRVRTGAQTLDVPNAGTAGAALFELDLSTLTQVDTWYDLLVGVTSTGSLTDLKDSMADMSTSLTLNSRTYEFREYFGDLKVNFVAAAPGSITVNSAEIVDDEGVPTLRVVGTLSGLSAGDAFLRVRSGAQTVNVPNTSVTPGEALFEFDLSTLTEAGTWYDLLTWVPSTDTLVDLKRDLVGDRLGVEVPIGTNSYSFREWDSNLKVNRSPV